MSKQGAAFLALVAMLLPASSVARADELLVMPYACTVVAGQPVLTPGPEQGHRVIGQRDQRKFSACSPVNPGMCRHWNVHRFDLDCDGQRVSWVSVVAATNEGSRRAWLLDGRLLLRMGPRWSLAPDDPCASEPGPGGRFAYGSLRRRCAERLALGPPPVVEMPFGYAPMLGFDGIFVTAAPQPPGVSNAPPRLPPVVAGAPSSKSAAADPKPQAAPAVPAPPRPPRREPAPKEAAPPAPQPASPLPVAPVPQPASRGPSAAQPPPPADEPAKQASPKPSAPKVAAATSPAAPKEAGPPGSRGPRLVAPPPPLPAPATETAPQSPPGQAAGSVASPVSEVQKKAPKAEPRPAAADASPVPTAAPAAPSPKDTGPPADPEAAFSPGILSLFRTTTTGAIVAFAGLALGLLTAFALARRREHAQDAGRRRRDVAALSLDGARTRASPRAGASRGRPARKAMPDTAANPAPSKAALPAGQSVAPRRAADWGDRMPRSREEALEVLGIGIAPSATETAIKKIVDGLRMSWHPDLAKDETDRALRELRSKQINAAWELLQAQRAEV